jgi:MFS family permease
MRIFATRKHEIGKKNLDFYSFGHLLYGYACNLVVFLIFSFLNLNQYLLAMGFVFSLWTSVLWELYENFLLKRRRTYGTDSLLNSLTDILMTMTGSAISHWWSFFIFEVYLLLSVVWILSMLVLYQIFWKITS